MMIQRRAQAAGLRTKISALSFRATGITTYPQNGGKLEIAQQLAGHESATCEPDKIQVVLNPWQR
jgi:site-specific recombinase XerD